MKRVARFALTFIVIGAAVARAEDSPPIPLPDNAALQYWQGSAHVSEATKKRLENFDTIAIDGEVLADVRDNNPSIGFVHAGAALSKCDWGLDIRQGSALLMPHLHMTRILGRLALLRARYRFDQGRWHDGLSDVLATFKLAKDAGNTPVMISLLVRYNIEQSSIDTLARQLPKMDRSTLDELAKVLETIPSPDAFKRVWSTESKYFVDWFVSRLDKIEKESGGDADKWSAGVLSINAISSEDAAELRRIGVPSPKKFRELMDALKGMLVEEERITDLPAAEQDAKLIEIQKPFAGNPLQKIFVPEQNKAFLTRRRWQARHAMLDAAVALVRDGEKVLQDKKYADPFGDGEPFNYRKIDGGFELKSKLSFEGGAVSVVFGAAK